MGHKEICLLSGNSYRQIDYMVQHGVICTNRPHPGSGAARTYTDDDAVIAAVVAQVRNVIGDFPMTLAKRMAHQVRAGHNVVLARNHAILTVDVDGIRAEMQDFTDVAHAAVG